MSISIRPLPGTSRDPLYPDSDGEPMAETDYHLAAIVYLYTALKQWFRSHDHVYVAADMLLYYEEGNPSAVRGPDVMLAKNVVGKHMRRSFRTWEEGVPPTVIIEVTSKKTRREDEVEKPPVYASIGVKELFPFDPEGEYLRPRLQGFELVAGKYVALPPNDAGQLFSRELGLVLAIEDHLLRLIDPRGKPLPTADELAEQAKQARSEVKKAERETNKAKRDADKAKREAEEAKRQAATLEAELARLRAKLPPDDRKQK
ncbi:MAG TPA: Uma2 family endonuclease [Pirellulales bacterium]|nr:Uma2 family endonuclease [Pirellulales bacterium]